MIWVDGYMNGRVRIHAAVPLYPASRTAPPPPPPPPPLLMCGGMGAGMGAGMGREEGD